MGETIKIALPYFVVESVQAPLLSVEEQLDAVIAKENPTPEQIRPYAQKAYFQRIHGQFIPSTPEEEAKDWKTGKILFAVDKSLGRK